jgi:hypothetical protein
MGASQTAEGAIMSSRKSNPLRRRRGPHASSARDRRPTRHQAMRATFEQLVRENPPLASAVLGALRVIAGVDRRRAMLLIEAASAIVVHSPSTTLGEGRMARVLTVHPRY